MTTTRYAIPGEPFLDLLAERVAAAREAGLAAPVTVLLPTYASVFYVRRDLAARAGGLFNVSFTRPEDLAEALAAARAEPTRRLSRAKAAELAYSVLTDASDTDLGPLAPLRDHSSTAAAVHAAFDALRPLSEGDLDAIAAADALAAASVRLYRRFQDRSAGYSDQLTASRRAAEVLQGDPDALSARFGHTIVAILEDPAPQFLPLLRALLWNPAAESIAALTGEPRADARVHALASVGPAGANHESPLQGAAATTSLISAPDPAEEVRQLIRNILAQANSGLRFGEIAVLHATPAYATRVEHALAAAGIPISGPDPHPLAHSPAGRFVTHLISIFETGLARESLTDWLAGSPVREPTGVAVPASRWDRISRQAGILGGAAQWDSRLSACAGRLRAQARHAEQTGEREESTIRGLDAEAGETEALRAFIADLATREPPGEPVLWSEHVSWLRAMFDDYCAAAPDRIELLLDELATLDEIGGPRPDFARFATVLRDQLGSPTRATRRLGHGVFVASVRDAVGAAFKAVHILGMAEGAFPGATRDDPILPDRLHCLVSDDGRATLPTRAHREASDRRSYLNALATAPHRTLYWPRSEPSGGSLKSPARWFLEAARQLSGDDSLESSDILELAGEPWLAVIESPESGVSSAAPDTLASDHEYRLRSLALATREGTRLPDHWLAADADHLASASRLERSRYSTGWTVYDGNLRGHPTAAPGVPVSATRLETWAVCPFRYLMGNVFALTPIPSPEQLLSISALDRGSLMHEIFEQIVQRRIDTGRAVAPEEVAAIADAAFADYENRGLTGKRVLWELDKERIRREIARFIAMEAEREAQTGLRATHAELKFGLDPGGHPPFQLRTADGTTLIFRGAIDRVERSDDGRIAVIDYKTGSKLPYRGMKDDPLQSGRRLQLPVYALAARRILNTTGDVEAAYWFTSEQGGFELIPVSLAENERKAVEAISRIASGIAAGVFPARPGDSGYSPGSAAIGKFENCLYCDFDRICAVNRDRVWESKKIASELADFLDLTGEDAQ